MCFITFILMEVMDSMQTGGGDSTIDSFPPVFFNVLVLMLMTV